MSKINLISTGQSAITLPGGREVPAVAGTPFEISNVSHAERLVRLGAAEIVASPKPEGPKPQHTIKELTELLAALDDAAAVQELLDAELALPDPRATAVKQLEAKLAKLAEAGSQGGQNSGDSASAGSATPGPDDTTASGGNATANTGGNAAGATAPDANAGNASTNDDTAA